MERSAFYLVFDVEKIGDAVLADIEWDIRTLEKYRPGRDSSKPFAVTLAELMLAKE